METAVGVAMEIGVAGETVLALQVAPGGAGTLVATDQGGAVSSRRLVDPDGNAIDVLRVGPGRLSVRYQASVPVASAAPRRATEVEELIGGRPSRYCPSDRMAELAASVASTLDPPLDRVRAVNDHVFGALTYTVGASTAQTDALETLSSGAGVCRDYAHVMVALCRALDVPARVAAVYAPGLSPMDFHLVAETVIDGTWYVWDTTRLASRHHLVRIATGRDAADVSFCTSLGPGSVTIDWLEVIAVAPTDIRPDDYTSLVSLA